MNEKGGDGDMEKFMAEMMQNPEKLKDLQDQDEDPTI